MRTRGLNGTVRATRALACSASMKGVFMGTLDARVKEQRACSRQEVEY